jgi:hypothetical protein
MMYIHLRTEPASDSANSNPPTAEWSGTCGDEKIELTLYRPERTVVFDRRELAKFLAKLEE